MGPSGAAQEGHERCTFPSFIAHPPVEQRPAPLPPVNDRCPAGGTAGGQKTRRGEAEVGCFSPPAERA
eukprot:1768722-Pyramimonas_sp.AAC.1